MTTEEAIDLLDGCYEVTKDRLGDRQEEGKAIFEEMKALLVPVGQRYGATNYSYSTLSSPAAHLLIRFGKNSLVVEQFLDAHTCTHIFKNGEHIFTGEEPLKEVLPDIIEILNEINT